MLRQQGADLLVERFDAQGNVIALTIPGHRTGILVVIVLPHEELFLNLATIYDDGAACYCELSRYDVDAAGEDWRVAAAMQAAEHQLALGDRAAIQRASDLLDDVIGQPTTVPLMSDAVVFMAALIAYQRFSFERAEKLLATLSKGWRMQPDLLVATDWAMGALALERYNAAGSLEFLQRALSTIEDSRQKLPWLGIDEVEIRLFMALVLMRLNRSTEGVQELEKGLIKARELGSVVLEGKIRNNYSGYFELYTGEPLAEFPENHQKSFSQLEQALELLDPSGEITTRVSTLGNLGRLSIISGDLGQAQSYYQSAIALNNTNHNEVLSGYHYAQLGKLYLMLGDYNRAQKYVEHAFNARQSAGALLIAAKDGIALATIYRELGQISKSLEFGKNALNYLQVHGTFDDQAQAMVELVFALLLAGDTDSALPLSAQAVELSEKVSFPWLLVDIHLVRAQALSQTNSDQANDQFTVAVEQAQRAGPVPNVVPTLLAASYFHRLRNPGLSLSLVLSAMEIVEGTRGQLDAARLGPHFSNRNHDVYVHAAFLALDAYERSKNEEHLLEAICRLERGRTYSLLAERRGKVVDDEEITRIKRELNILTHKRVSGDTDSDLLRRYDECVEALNARGVGSEISFDFGFKSVASVQTMLNDSAAIFYYLFSDSERYLIRILNSGLTLFTLPSAQFDAEVSMELSRVRSPASPDESMNKLSTMLLPETAFDEQRIENLFVVAHGSLEQVPFSALTLPTASVPTPIGSFCSVQMLRSLVSIEESTITPVHDYQVAVLADPEFSSALTSAAPDIANESFRDWSESLSRLPWTAEEAGHIQALYGENDSLIFVGKQANRHNLFREEVKNARILHIASHGFFSSEMEEIVGVALTPAGDSDTGFVALTDLLGEKFTNQLVVISGCETGLGQNLQGEGALSLGRAFVASGAKMVISTLWPVSDKASAVFMSAFYSSLKSNGGDPSIALQSAQDLLRKNHRFCHPCFWAGYVLHTTSLKSTVT